MTNHLHQNDLPEDLDLGPIVAIDCETMGLIPQRDRLCLVQMSSGDGDAHLVQIAKGQTEAPRLTRDASRSERSEAFPLRSFRYCCDAACVRGAGHAGLVHQDRLETGAHLHRPAMG